MLACFNLPIVWVGSVSYGKLPLFESLDFGCLIFNEPCLLPCDPFLVSDLVIFDLVFKLSLVVLLLKSILRLELSIDVFLDLLNLIFELLDVSPQLVLDLHACGNFFSD
jgi:hypothetical protein